MGTRMAPTYANLYMGLLEEQLLEQTTLKPLVWFRFIDDIFFLWTFGPTKLQQFFDVCNSFDPHIKFEQTVSSTTIPFLDVQVILDNGKIKTDLYTKPTDTHQYLNWTSCHPCHTKAAIHTAWHSDYAASARKNIFSKNEHGNFSTSYLTGATSPNTSNSP